MKILTASLFAVVAFVICGQPNELICFNPPPLPADSVAARSSIEELQPLLEQTQALIESQLEGLSIEEAAQAGPIIFSNTGYLLIKQVLENFTEDDLAAAFNPGDLAFVSLQSFLNATNGMEIFETMIQEPESIARGFLLLVQKFDLDCIEKPELLFLNMLTSLMSDLLQKPFRDSFVDIFNATFVTLSIQANFTESMISVLEPLSENLDTADNVDGALASLLSFVTDDSITATLSSALESSGLVPSPEGVGEILTSFFVRIQNTLEIDGQEFVTFINDIFKRILAAVR